MSDLTVLETYKNDLQKYSLEQLRYIADDGVWSMCQMYNHLIVVANEYLDNVEACDVADEEQQLGKTTFGEKLFKNGGFPPIKIKLPDELNSLPSNMESNEELVIRLDQVIERLKKWESKLNNISPNYKVQHGGFGWLNAREWYELVGMHFRHHLRQKGELEQKLGL